MYVKVIVPNIIILSLTLHFTYLIFMSLMK